MSIYPLLFALIDQLSNPNYLRRYCKFVSILKARNLKKQKGHHSHHIIPKALGGGESPENTVIVSLREHFVLHWILWKAFPNSGMATAFRGMCNGWRHYGFRVTSRVFEKVMLESSERTSKLRKGIPNLKLRGRIRSKEHCQHLSDSRKGVPSPLKGIPNLSAKGKPSPKKGILVGPQSKEHRLAISIAMKESYLAPGRIEKQRLTNKEVSNREEVKAKRKETFRLRKLAKESYLS